ncbi:flagellar filament capping protein FliD [Aliarcobacter butzleri]|uniref:flagellar filament capping protein FliD n=1 Tax=Aliarcobacter butzleri TaxID=28197 RepID=UPI00125F8077|nr:flagellar filament capping protein FliD [Aliarcobacter butzleri]MCT7563687.1 flagellar filament capping protein FliD [Aliarcobacter butzleri]MCT7621717.1 flagellar filament capping protein FliD [Aliarcobacter butzleri]
MAGVLGLGSSGSTSLNEALIEKLKEADKASSVTPLEKKLEKFTTEKEVVANIQTKVSELLSAVKVFSLNQTTGANAFQQKSANVTGDGVVFDSDDLSALKSGSLSVKVEKLAKKDVWQTNQFDGTTVTKDSKVNQGTLTINGTNIDTTNKSYSDLVKEINKIDGVQASIVEDSIGKFRISIKSAETGEANKINFNSTNGELSEGAAIFGNAAQKDTWQTNEFDGTTTTKDSIVNQGTLTINGTNIDTTNKSYSDLVKEINKIDGVQASIVEDSIGKFRLSIESKETGIANKINFEGSAEILEHFGLNNENNNVIKAQDLKIDIKNNVLQAEDMQMKVDGVEYSGSTNTITIDGLKITATKSDGESTISIEDDNSNIKTQMQAFVTAYNTLNTLISGEVYNADSSLGDKASIRNVMSQLKEQLFGTGNGDKTIFSYGFSFDSSNGNLVLSSTEFDNAIKNDKEGLQNLFVGVAQKKGIGTTLDELISNSGINKSLIDYESNMLSRETKLTEQKDAAQEALDAKYKLMAQQFAAYTTIITQMENSFSGLKMLIQQSTASN